MNTLGFGLLVALGPTAFATIVWGSVALVAAVFGYVLVTYAREGAQGT